MKGAKSPLRVQSGRFSNFSSLKIWTGSGAKRLFRHAEPGNPIGFPGFCAVSAVFQNCAVDGEDDGAEGDVFSGLLQRGTALGVGRGHAPCLIFRCDPSLFDAVGVKIQYYSLV